MASQDGDGGLAKGLSQAVRRYTPVWSTGTSVLSNPRGTGLDERQDGIVRRSRS